MQLTPMSEEEFQVWSARAMASYAADKMKANALSKEAAARIAQDDFTRYLPHGRKSENAFLFTANDSDANTVGYVWFTIRGEKADQRAFILDIIVEPDQRGKGYGKQIMRLVEEKVRALDVFRIGLHVFGFNKRAIALYQSLDYETTDLIMEKSLG